MTASVPCDLAVIGGGPAGSVLAALVAQAGHRVVLLERETGPRYRIGESLLPATIQDIAPMIGAKEAIEAADFVLKRGATFCWGDRPDEPWTLAFGPSIETGRTAFNVDRSRFDEILIEAAIANGAEVRRGVTVTDVSALNGQGRRTLSLSGPGGETTLDARITANASGQMRFRIPELDSRQQSAFFRKVALWGYWDGAGRLDPPLEGTVFFETTVTERGEAWLWYIPMSDGRTSVGVVVPRECVAEIRPDPRAALLRYLEGCPRTMALLESGRPSTDEPYDRVRTCIDYSFAADAFWAPGIFAVGDAACFIDVLLSSGVHLATYGALLAARSVNAVLAGEVIEAHAMNEYESRLRQEYAVFYAGLSGLYDMTRSRDYYGTWLRTLLQNCSGAILEPQESAVEPWGLNAPLAIPTKLSLPEQAERNVRMMRAFTASQLAYDGPPRATPAEALPALRNTLCAGPGASRWRLPSAIALAAE